MVKIVSLLESYRTWLFDLDGTVFYGSQPIPTAINTIKILEKNSDYTIRYITNNASSSGLSVAQKLCNFGLKVAKNQVITSAKVAAKIAYKKCGLSENVFILGSPALQEEFHALGFNVVNAHDSIGLVVQGLYKDTRWQDLADAAKAIHHGAKWIACNADPTLPSPGGLLPGNGALVQALGLAVSPKEPLIVGKPAPEMIYYAMESDGTLQSVENISRNSIARNTIAIGDRLDTDIASARAAGVASLLVLTGVSTLNDVLRAPNNQQPEYISKNLTITDDITHYRIATHKEWHTTWEISTDDIILKVTGPSKEYDVWKGVLHTLYIIKELSDVQRRKLVLIAGNDSGEQVIKTIFS